ANPASRRIVAEQTTGQGQIAKIRDGASGTISSRATRPRSHSFASHASSSVIVCQKATGRDECAKISECAAFTSSACHCRPGNNEGVAADSRIGNPGAVERVDGAKIKHRSTRGVQYLVGSDRRIIQQRAALEGELPTVIKNTGAVVASAICNRKTQD